MAKQSQNQRDLSVSEQKALAKQEADGGGSDTANVTDEANVAAVDIGGQEKSALIGDDVKITEKEKPASISMATESAVSSDDSGKVRSELRQALAERDNYKRQFDAMARENEELRLMLKGASIVGSGKL